MLTPDDITILNTWKAIGDRWRVTAERIYETVEWCISHRSMEGLTKMDYAFDPTGITPNFGGSSGLPVGKHPVTITKSEGKPTKDNTGGYLEFTLTAFDGPAKGISAPLRLNVHNTSEVAVKIAREQLAAICAVTGVGPFQNTHELHDKPFVVEIVPQKNDPKFTEVGAVFDMNGNAPGEQQPQQQQGTGNGGFGGGGTGGGNSGFGGGASGTGNIPDKAAESGTGGGGGFGGGNGWQQGGGSGGDGGAKPGWGQR